MTHHLFWPTVLVTALAAWVFGSALIANLVRQFSHHTCESCGERGDVRLDDGSWWCLSCTEDLLYEDGYNGTGDAA
jgi:hypothetical protein